MLLTHCSGCRATFAENSYSSTVKVALFSPEGVLIESEVPRHLCYRCMAKIRSGLDMVDGKTDSVDNSLNERVGKLEERMHETYHQHLDQRVFQIEVALDMHR